MVVVLVYYLADLKVEMKVVEKVDYWELNLAVVLAGMMVAQ